MHCLIIGNEIFEKVNATRSHTHSRILHNGQQVETTHAPRQRTGLLKLLNIQNGILFSQ